MPLINSSSNKAFKKNLRTEMHHGKPQKQSLAIAYAMKRKAQANHMAMGGSTDDHEGYECPQCEGMGCASCDPDMMAEGGMMDRVGRIMMQRRNKAQEANDTSNKADFKPNEFDELVLDDDEPMKSTASADVEIGDEQEDMDRRDIVSRIMRARKMRDKMPGTMRKEIIGG